MHLIKGTATLERNHLHASCKRYLCTPSTDPHHHWKLNSSAKSWLLPCLPGCFLSLCSELKLLSRVRLLVTPWTSPWNSLSQNTGVGCLSLLHRIFPTQGSNPGLLHFKWILYQLSHKGNPRILEWVIHSRDRVAYPFSSGSSQPRNQSGVSWIAGGFFTNWAIREALCEGGPIPFFPN